MVFHAHQRGRHLRPSELDGFAARGIDAFDLATPWPVLADRVVFEGKAFVFASGIEDGGELAFTLAVVSDDGLVDIVAWQPQTGSQALWLGSGFALGERQINHPNPRTNGLLVHRSPMGWLRAGRSGIVILRDDFAPQLLARVPILVAEDTAHQRELQAFFPHGYFDPRIEVREPTSHVPLAEECVTS
jgi:hypothetical protein